MKINKLIAALSFAVLGAGSIYSAPIVFSGSSGTRAFSASFDVINSTQLQVVLTNLGTAPAGNIDGSNMIGGLYFDIAGNPTLTRISAAVSSGSSVIQNGVSTVGQYWGLYTGANVYQNNADYSLRGVGYGQTGGPNGNFCTTGCTQLNGADYMVAYSSYVAGTGNGNLGTTPLIRNSITFVMDGLPSNFNLNSISSVGVQYGTSLSEPFIPTGGQVPEPGTWAMLGIGMFALGIVGRRK